MQKRFKSFYLRQLWRVWARVPRPVRRLGIMRGFARHIDRIARLYEERSQHFATFFLRNRAELEVLQRLVDKTPRGAQLRMSIFACSKGAEVYSMAWAIRTARPDIELRIDASDISPEIVEFASCGVYDMRKPQPKDISTEEVVQRKDAHVPIPTSDQHAWIFERLSKEEIDSIFEVRGEEARIKDWLREGITWQRSDASDPDLPARIGKYDIVIANRFLCHMVPQDAKRCLRNLDRFVRPGGYLFVNGVDVDVRTAIAIERGWSPVTLLLREVHACDDLLGAWPVHYWGLEPMDDGRPDWQMRYASVFEIGKEGSPAVDRTLSNPGILETPGEALTSLDTTR